MCSAIENRGSCGIRSVILILPAKNMSAAEMHHELCGLRQKVVSEGTVRQWCRMLKDGLSNVHNEERSGRPVICSK
jgi:hypothetical protein